jgi:hypothetical protein
MCALGPGPVRPPIKACKEYDKLTDLPNLFAPHMGPLDNKHPPFKDAVAARFSGLIYPVEQN